MMEFWIFRAAREPDNGPRSLRNVLLTFFCLVGRWGKMRRNACHVLRKTFLHVTSAYRINSIISLMTSEYDLFSILPISQLLNRLSCYHRKSKSRNKKETKNIKLFVCGPRFHEPLIKLIKCFRCVELDSILMHSIFSVGSMRCAANYDS